MKERPVEWRLPRPKHKHKAGAAACQARSASATRRFCSRIKQDAANSINLRAPDKKRDVAGGCGAGRDDHDAPKWSRPVCRRSRLVRELVSSGLVTRWWCRSCLWGERRGRSRLPPPRCRSQLPPAWGRLSSQSAASIVFRR